MQPPQRLDVSFTIVWQAPWHVGSGRGSLAADRLLRRRRCGPGGTRAPYVPGSQIKGVLRHRCECLLLALGGRAVSPHATPAIPDELLRAFLPLAQSPYLVDRLFGNRYQGECLFVEDAVPAEAAMLPVELRSRTAMDRLTGTVREQTLFTTEIAPPLGMTLRSRLAARHPPGVLTQESPNQPPLEYPLLIAALLSIDALGGDKSIGLGACRIELTDIQWNGRPYDVRDILKPLEDPEWHGLIELHRSG